MHLAKLRIRDPLVCECGLDGLVVRSDSSGLRSERLHYSAPWRKLSQPSVASQEAVVIEKSDKAAALAAAKNSKNKSDEADVITLHPCTARPEVTIRVRCSGCTAYTDDASAIARRAQTAHGTFSERGPGTNSLPYMVRSAG
ncbi:hypothetical protein EVAR_95465_1 [Eumeta japonica]|uniref:Uncharacterized protein n=1 Tax=Eumeta variegata TaxID=151549 RepID=A0A4C1UK09_EUMVA|nr:hypothetical protein EVAR_95465_1 [Eumeta japonica]